MASSTCPDPGMVLQNPYDHNNLLVIVDPDCRHENPISLPAKDGDVGYDLKAMINNEHGSIVIPPCSMVNVRTGVSFKLPNGVWGDIRPRSSTFAKRKLFVMPATIDPGYTGVISIFVWNPTDEPHDVVDGDRLAQLVLIPKVIVPIKIVTELPQTERGDSGFGSTGRR